MGTEGDHNMYHRSINQFFSLIISINLSHYNTEKPMSYIPSIPVPGVLNTCRLLGQFDFFPS